MQYLIKRKQEDFNRVKVKEDGLLRDMKRKLKELPLFIFIQQKPQYSKFPDFPPR